MIEARKRSVQKSHDRRSRKLSELGVGQSVFFQYTEGKDWKIGQVIAIIGPNTYQVNWVLMVVFTVETACI